MYIHRNGHEYDEIFPAWDWRKLPGVTSVIDDAPLDWSKAPDRKQQPEFVGAASDGENAAVAMDLHRDKLRAKKAWFFAGHFVVCLGTDIQYDGGNEPVVTTINQCLLNGPVKVQQGGHQSEFSGPAQKLNDIEWVEHAGVRYVLIEPTTVNVAAEGQSGNWRKIFDTPSTPKADVTKNVFTLGIEHGPKSYAYYVMPAAHADETPVKVLSNTSKLQAVQVATGWIGAVFWSAGSANVAGVAIDVDQPCVTTLTSVPDGQRVTIADPTQRLRTIKLNVEGMSQAIDLPQGGDAGKSVSVHFGTTRR
jgi:chondroitin AC lyase